MLSEKEGKWRINLPETYKEFVKKYNGGAPIKNRFKCSNYMYMIDRFLCILNITGERDDECYDIGAVRTQLEERIVFDENLVGTELLPIAVLFAGDFVCLDYRNNVKEPTVCVRKHEESTDLNPVTSIISEKKQCTPAWIY
ncbi:SMI1/KNR4 family protein [Priestia aryabhattai]|uniref:SMI1/KNR4 family protein n=1 Tax=Priestia aryabhattai TaxID=412384 RepID=UPI0027DF0BB6|nr:SMI1/KNR4 family protein [Priestia aryabhattai]